MFHFPPPSEDWACPDAQNGNFRTEQRRYGLDKFRHISYLCPRYKKMVVFKKSIQNR